jgi:hypothetical protein
MTDNNNENLEEKFAKEPLLTEEESWDVLAYAKQLGGMYGNAYLNPFLTNARLMDINLNTSEATQSTLDAAMKNPKASEKQLQDFSEDFELRSMVYKRLISYLANMLSFDATYTSSAEPQDYSTPKYKKSLKAVEAFLDKFNYKKEFRIVIKEMLRNDAYFGCFRDVGDSYILQELPPEYCKITGRWAGGFLFSFNMYWFLIPGVDLNMYPDFFKKKYKEIFGNSKMKEYNPALSANDRGSNGNYVYWTDVPIDVGTCFKMNQELATRLPYFSPIFNDLVLQTLMRNLQKNISMAAASKMIIGQVPMLNKEAKATVKDSLAISPELLGKFMALVKSAISESIKVASAPLENMKGISFEGDNAMYDQYLRTALATSGVNTNLIFSSNIKPNAVETQLSLNVDEQLMTVLYEPFNDFMNYFINKVSGAFTFKLQFEGTDFFLDRQARFDKAMSLFDKGIMLPQKIAASIGMKPAQFRKHMEESSAMGFIDMLTPPMVGQQRQMIEDNPSLAAMPSTKTTGSPSSSAKKTAGAPKKPTAKLGEEGANTRESGGNIGRGGKS